MADAKPRVTRAPIVPDEGKFAELILHIAKQSQDDPRFGLTKLNKLAWIADFAAYGMTGKPITGVEYQKLKNGPAARRMLPIMEKLKIENSAAEQVRDYYGKPQKRLIPLREPDLKAFSGEQIALVDDVIKRFRGKSATEMSDGSHEFMGWIVADVGETIPYTSVFLGNRRSLTPREEEYAASIKPTCVG